jgi:hypothetical protein
LLTSLFAWFFACKPIELSGKYCVMPNALALQAIPPRLPDPEVDTECPLPVRYAADTRDINLEMR